MIRSRHRLGQIFSTGSFFEKPGQKETNQDFFCAADARFRRSSSNVKDVKPSREKERCSEVPQRPPSSTNEFFPHENTHGHLNRSNRIRYRPFSDCFINSAFSFEEVLPEAGVPFQGYRSVLSSCSLKASAKITSITLSMENSIRPPVKQQKI